MKEGKAQGNGAGPRGTHRGPSSPAAPVPMPACARPPVCERARLCAAGAGESFPLGMGNRAGAVDMEVGGRGEDPRLMSVLVRHKNVAGRRRKSEVLSVCAPVGRRVSSACRHGQRLKPDARNAQYAPHTQTNCVSAPFFHRLHRFPTTNQGAACLRTQARVSQLRTTNDESSVF